MLDFSSKNSKKIILLIFTIAIIVTTAILFSACSKEENTSGNEADKIVKIGLLRIDDSIPFFVAEKEQLFEKNGANVELISFSSSLDQSRALEAGELDMVMNDMIVQALMKKSDTDTRVVSIAYGANESEGRFLLLSSPNSNISNASDLIGKRIAISSNTMMDYLVEQFADLGLYDYEGIETVSIPNLMLRTEALIEGGDIEVAILPDPLASYAENAGCNVIVDDTLLTENLSQSVVLATKELIDENGDDIKPILNAYYEAMDLINNDPDEYREFCLETANVPKELSDTYPTPNYTTRALPTEKEVTRIMEWLEKRSLIERPFLYDEIVDGSFI